MPKNIAKNSHNIGHSLSNRVRFETFQSTTYFFPIIDSLGHSFVGHPVEPMKPDILTKYRNYSSPGMIKVWLLPAIFLYFLHLFQSKTSSLRHSCAGSYFVINHFFLQIALQNKSKYQSLELKFSHWLTKNEVALTYNVSTQILIIISVIRV